MSIYSDFSQIRLDEKKGSQDECEDILHTNTQLESYSLKSDNLHVNIQLESETLKSLKVSAHNTDYGQILKVL